MLKKKRELTESRIAALTEQVAKFSVLLSEAAASIALLDSLDKLGVGDWVEFYTGTYQEGLVLGVDTERERVRVFVGAGLESKAITIPADRILKVEHAEIRGVATPSPETSGGPTSTIPPQGRQNAKAEPIRIQ